MDSEGQGERLSYEDMLKMMANENLSEYGGNGWVEVGVGVFCISPRKGIFQTRPGRD
jgi:hypothetical protein